MLEFVEKLPIKHFDMKKLNNFAQNYTSFLSENNSSMLDQNN